MTKIFGKMCIRDRITGEVTYDTQTTTNTYNAAGKRLKRVEEDKTTRFYYMGEALLFTTNQDLVMTSENVLNTGGQIIASKRFAVPGVEVTDPFAGQYYFYQYDVRGSVTDILDKNAGLVKGYDYDEFGNTEEKGNENFLNDVTFTGSVSDASSGLQYMNARFYQPSTGRFLSQDSYTGNPYDPWTQHLYSYCGNNPVNMVDPTGHTIQEIQKESIRIRKDKARYEKLVADSGALMSKYYNRNFKEYIWNRNIYYYYTDKIKEIEKREKEINDELKWQGMLNRGEYKEIRQDKFSNIPLFNGNVANNGCGMVAATNVASMLGADVDIDEALKYFNQPQNEFLGTGAIKPSVVREYLTNKGYSARYDAMASPNGTFIGCYIWVKNWQVGGHYVACTTDDQGRITPYNGCLLYTSG